MKKYIKTLLSAVLAGAMIALACTIYLYIKQTNLIIGAMLFGFGLLCVVTLDFKLYTGRVAYVIDKPKSYMIEILWIILGNFLGVLLIFGIVYLANLEIVISEAQSLVTLKLSRNIFEMFGLSILCGMMMYLGVDGYKRAKNDMAKVVINVFAVMIFVLAGFEHSIANMFYFLVSGTYDLSMILAILIMLLGNGVGAISLNLIEKFAKTKIA